jgi:hypothetical protein
MVGLLALAPLLILVHPRARAALRLSPGFRPLPEDSRVMFEPGAAAHARRMARALPAAIERVETEQGRPFRADVRVYVCATHETFAEHTGQPPTIPVRGMALLWDVWVSPLAFRFEGQDTHRETLTHELSHLHLKQHLGWLGNVAGLPAWFREGLADQVAGTGHERVSRAAALAALRAGPRLDPELSGGPREHGLSWPMFHGQARLFTEHLRARDPHTFRSFLAAVLDGEPFARATRDHLGATLPQLWSEYLADLQVTQRDQ